MTNASGVSHKKKDAHPSGRTVVGMQVATALEKTGTGFWKWVEEIENSELFRRLHQPTLANRAITVNLIKNYYIPRINSGREMSKSIREVIKDDPTLHNLFLSIGWNRFYYYYIEKQGTVAERSEPLRAICRDLHSIEAATRSLLGPTGIFDPETREGHGLFSDEQEVVAEVLFPDRKVLVSHTYPSQRYTFDDDKLYNLITDGTIQQHEVKDFYFLRRVLESINLRFSLINRVVEQAIQQQKTYLAHDDEKKMQVLEEQKVAEFLDVDPSWVSRIVKNKCLFVQHRLVCLKDLFISGRNLNKKRGIALLQRIITRQNQRLKEHKISRQYSDEELRLQFLNEFEFKVSRRSLNNWKRELERENENGKDEHLGQDR